MARIDHTNHAHENTPAGRAACRKFMAEHHGMDAITWRVAQEEQEIDDAFEGEQDLTGPALLGEVVDEDGTPDRSFDRTERKRLSDIHARAASARQLTNDRQRAAGRTARKPRPVKAKKIVRTGGCVQAELHTGVGRCACGWSNGM